jgi:hypothetical protein
MNNPTQYSDPEFAFLMRAFGVVFLASSSADGIQALGVLKETNAATDFLNEAVAKYSRNALVLSAIQAAANDPQLTAPQFDGSAGDLRAYLSEQIDQVVGVLRNDAEAYEFKQFLFDLAVVVANVAGKGLFGRGDKVTREEAEFLHELQYKFGLA